MYPEAEHHTHTHTPFLACLALYNALFQWLVLEINKQLFTGDEDKVCNHAFLPPPPLPFFDSNFFLHKISLPFFAHSVLRCLGVSRQGTDISDMLWIGILDVFGFERFDHNSFEQVQVTGTPYLYGLNSMRLQVAADD